GVSFVEMEDGRLDPHVLERAIPPYAEQDLLLDAGLLITAIEAGGQGLVLRRVGVVAGVQKEEPAASDRHAPEPDVDVTPRQLDGESSLLPLLFGFGLQ